MMISIITIIISPPSTLVSRDLSQSISHELLTTKACKENLSSLIDCWLKSGINNYLVTQPSAGGQCHAMSKSMTFN